MFEGSRCPRDDTSETLPHIAAQMAKSNYIKEWRTARGLNQEQLAEKAGLSKGYVSDLERGNKPYNQRVLESIADVLKCSPAALLGDPAKTKLAKPSIDQRLLSLSLKAAMEEAAESRQPLGDKLLANIVETACRIYGAYTGSRETELQDIREH